MPRINNYNKKFIELTDKDSIFYINPFTQEVMGLKIKEIKGEPEAGPRAVKITVFRNEAILHSPDIESVVTQDYIFPGDEVLVIATVMIENMPTPIPVPYSSSRNTLQSWMDRTK